MESPVWRIGSIVGNEQHPGYFWGGAENRHKEGLFKKVVARFIGLVNNDK